ncbi:carboxymuconolactone decarboxylase family protein [Dongia sp.]|jgi:AhpD family alkylhydroperoxidase|uniref:carboxymuconolactone decarboxylase family protein n=1 Tax=Dongia sp. TaxID=1977262 RepID=UPI0035B0DEFF
MSVAPRITQQDFYKIAPAARDALIALGKAVDASGLPKDLTELLKLRISQMNGCAFCLNMHLGIARKLGVPAAKLDLVAAWRDADIYSARERAALAWAEALTDFAHGAAMDGAYEALQQEFSQDEIAFLTAAIANINAWNRISVGLRFAPIIEA